ncbi:DUF885 domain-containing protein [Sphingomonas mesophila]|uniref:DUF885 domain-containing protein n=1 Tax=Sphingomonas mesophila TaxID=2303576 RepID=UPI000E57A7C6|nr:DUF885 family protein [Sphingomonas mesophila]
MTRTLLLAATLAATALPAAARAQAPAPTAPAPAGAADQALVALHEGFATWQSREYGSVEDSRGQTDQAHYLPRVDPATMARRGAHLAGLLAQARRIDPAALSPAQQVNRAVLIAQLEAAVADISFRDFEMPANSDSNFWTYHEARGQLSDAASYKRYIARMRDLPRFFDENIANMRAGLKRRFTPPRLTLEGRDSSIANYIKPVADSAFYSSFRELPANIPAAEAERLRADARAAIQGSVIPAYRKLLAFWRDEYVPGARTTTAARDLPNGDGFYRSQVRKYTTLELTPEEIHQVGLKEVARIQAEMAKTMRAAGHAGDFASFLKFLKSDPRFIARTPDELLGVSSYVAKRVDGKLKDYFELLPRRPFTIIPVPEALAPFYTAGRGGLGSCQMNTYNLPVRQLYNIPALTLHECAPGHAFQAALAEEGPALPRFRRNLYFSGYGEGWGLYVEWLGNEMGIYRNPYERFGQQSYEMWRAARLVIDTGLHLYGWDRQKAVDYLAGHTALSGHEVGTEVDRYISWPGQALSYKLGEITIRRLRAAAEKELGSKFDIRKFHTMILGIGAVPLPVLESEVRKFIAASRRAQ